MTPEEMIKQIKLIINHHSCIECKFFTKYSNKTNDYICDKFNVKPPVEIIVIGCEYFDSVIPF